MCPDCLRIYNQEMEKLSALQREIDEAKTLLENVITEKGADDPLVEELVSDVNTLIREFSLAQEKVVTVYDVEDEVIGWNQEWDPEKGDWVDGRIPRKKCGVCGSEFWDL